MSKEVFEEAIEHANVCLKRWQQEGRDTKNYDQVKSLILTWLNKACLRHFSNYGNWRERKAIARGLSDSTFFTLLHGDDLHITSISVVWRVDGKELTLPDLDYKELNRRANARIANSPFSTSIENINFDSIKNFRF